MRRAGRAVTAIFTLLAFIVGFVGVTATLDVTQPAIQDTDAVVSFQVRPGDGTAILAERLQQAGLIRNGMLFRLVAGTRHLDGHLEPGIYDLSRSMTMGAIVQRLLNGHPDEELIIVPPGKVVVTVPPGMRVTEYPAYFTSLASFNAKNFLKIATSGVLPDGKQVSDRYWFVRAKRADVPFALEGYLFPGTYFFNTSDDEVAAVNRLLMTFGEHLCPGPDAAHPDAYVQDRGQCKAHAATVKVGDKTVDIFTEMEHRYFTSDDVIALFDAVLIGSLAARISFNDADAPGVTAVYYNRYIASRTNGYTQSADWVQNLGSDASVQYARDTDTAPKDGNWWAPLADVGANIAPDSPYNSDVPDNTGLIPGPIAAPTWADVVGAATAGDPTPSPYYYVAADRCGRAHYAKTLAEFLYVQANARTGC